MSRQGKLRIVLVVVLAGAIGWTLGHREALDGAALEAWVAGLGPWGPLAFVALYAAATVLFAPGGLLTIAGGAVFGPVLGALLSLFGATLGASMAFLIARHVAGAWVARRAAGGARRLIDGVEAEGWRFVAFTRLVPVFPFNLLNYALGLTRIPLSAYVVTSFVTMAPGGFAYAYLGHAGREAVAGGEEAIQKGLLALGLLALVAFLPGLVKRLRRGGEGNGQVRKLGVAELKQRLEQGPGPLVLDVRDAADFVGELGHVAGAINIPLPELEARLGELEAGRDAPLAVLCRTDKRTAKAVALLRERGFAGLLFVDGGMVDWTRQGFPVEGKEG